MNNARFGNYAKLIAFFLVAVLLVIGFGFATEGWWQTDETNVTDLLKDSSTQNNPADSPTKKPEPDVPVITPPRFVNVLTGLESTEEASRRRHFAFVLETDSPLYGASVCDIVAEFPTESSTTRLLAFTNSLSTLSKIGSIAPTRAYISNVARFFSSAIVCKGNDGRGLAGSCNTSGAMFDMSVLTGYYYTEYTQFTYTNGDLINAGIYNANVNTTVENDASVPYNFVPFGSEVAKGDLNAKTVIIPFTQRSETELYYQSADRIYTFSKNGAQKSDMLNDKKISFKNVFVLLCNSVTYEDSDTTELVMKTVGSGSGYYICDGYAKSITWESDASGKLKFLDSSGNILTVSRGNSYIGFVKSSKIGEIKIS